MEKCENEKNLFLCSWYMEIIEQSNIIAIHSNVPTVFTYKRMEDTLSIVQTNPQSTTIKLSSLQLRLRKIVHRLTELANSSPIMMMKITQTKQQLAF